MSLLRVYGGNELVVFQVLEREVVGFSVQLVDRHEDGWQEELVLAQPQSGDDAIGVEGRVGREGREGRVECLDAVRGAVGRGGGALARGGAGFPRGEGVVLGGVSIIDSGEVSLTGAWGRGCLPFPQP